MKRTSRVVSNCLADVPHFSHAQSGRFGVPAHPSYHPSSPYHRHQPLHSRLQEGQQMKPQQRKRLQRHQLKLQQQKRPQGGQQMKPQGECCYRLRRRLRVGCSQHHRR